MYTLCTTEKSAAQQRLFEEAFLALLMEMPYDDITISELCRRAGFSRKIFYRLFEQKADVLYAAVDQALLDFENYQPDVSIVGEGGVHRFLSYWREQKPLLDGLERCNASSLLTDHAIRHVLKENAAVLKSFGADTSCNGKETIIFFLSGLLALVLAWYRNDYSRSIDEMAALIMELLTTPPIKAPIERK